MDECPGDSELEQLLTESLSGEIAARLTVHVDGCAPCRHALERLALRTDTVLVAGLHTADRPREEFLDRLKSRRPPGLNVDRRFSFSDRSDLTSVDRSTQSRDGHAGHSGKGPEPARIGPHAILGTLGDGGMGIVYKARHLGLDRLVAVKTLRGGSFAGQEHLERFRREAQAVGRLQHPNIVQIFDVGEHEGQPYFSMELVEGGSLAQHLAGQPLAPRAASALVETLARAVQHAHEHGIIHRDLKPSNILLQKDEGGRLKDEKNYPPSASSFILHPSSFVPKISDFGLAKQLDRGDLTRSDLVVGTPGYMAPEQADARFGPIGVTTDVYGLGAIFYQMLTGLPPFKAPSDIETIQLMLGVEVVSPRLSQLHLPRDLETICLKCLEKDPVRRYPTAAALADDLRRYLDGSPILARPTTLWERGRKWARRRPAVAALAAALTTVTLLAVAAVVWFALDALAARDEARKKQEDAETQRDKASSNFEEAKRQRAAERWQRYRANIATALSALQLGRGDDCRRSLELAPDEYRQWEWKYLNAQIDMSMARQISHQGSVLAVAITPDGRWAASAGDDGQVRIWDVASASQVAVLDGKVPLGGLLFSPTGTHVAAAGTNQGFYLWERHTWKRILALPEQSMRPSFSPDGTRVACGNPSGAVQVFDVRTGAILLNRNTQKEGHVETVDFHPDGKLLACGGADRTVYLVDTTTAAIVAELKGHERFIGRVRFSPDGKRLLSWSVFPDLELRLWDVEQTRLIATMPGHTNSCEVAAFSPDGSVIATGSLDQTIRLWNGTTGKLLAVLKGHLGRLYQLAFTPDGSKLLSSSGQDQAIRLWDVKTGEPLAIAHGHAAGVWGLALSTDGKTFVSGSADGTVRFWDRRIVEYQGIIRGHTGYVYAAVFSPDCEHLASTAWDGTARIWNVATGKELRQIPLGTTMGVSLAYSPDGKRLATMARDNAIHVWELSTGECVWSAPIPTDFYINPQVAWSPAGDVIACGTVGWGPVAIHLFEAGTGKTCKVLHGHEGTVSALAFSADGAMIATGGIDKTVRFWDVKTGESLGTCFAHKDTVQAVAFSPSGTVLATGSADQMVRLWDVASKKELKVLQHSSIVHSLAFEPQGARLAVACNDNTIRLWDAATWEEVAELRGHTAYVHTVTFSRDGTRLASASGDHTIRLWDTKTLQERAK